MSRSRRLRCVLAVLLGWALLAGTFQAAAPAVPRTEAPAATGQGAARAAAAAEAGSSGPVAAFAASGGPAGPACAPGAPGRDGVPALPARAGSDQAPAPAPPARPGPEVAVPARAKPVRVLVRGPGPSAPSLLELSVMRV